MKLIAATLAALLAFGLSAAAAEKVICSVAFEVGAGEPLLREGDCEGRVSPASTFKIPISLMGFDAGILTSPNKPEWPFKEGYSDWIPAWRQAQTPASWMQNSVVWYSQQITLRLGMERFAAYVDGFDYGNKDISGDKGKDNGLTHSWLSSSLQISPDEQMAFLARMIEGKLPVTPEAVANTAKIIEFEERPNGWRVFGKTGSGTPLGPDGKLLKDSRFGWYVGWAEKDGRSVVFTRLVTFDYRPEERPGLVARDGLFAELFGAGGPLN